MVDSPGHDAGKEERVSRSPDVSTLSCSGVEGRAIKVEQTPESHSQHSFSSSWEFFGFGGGSWSVAKPRELGWRVGGVVG